MGKCSSSELMAKKTIENKDFTHNKINVYFSIPALEVAGNKLIF